MSSPDSNIEKQKRRHRPSLIGIGAALLAAAVLLIVVTGWPNQTADEDQAAPATTAAPE